MANTVIQLKYSTATATPSSLNVAEPAYSYTSNTLFIGTPAGTGSIAIGGKFYIDQQGLIYNHANAAFLAANNASDLWVRNQANAAFISANSAGDYANAAFRTANNSAAVNDTQNNSITAAFSQANTATDTGTSAFIQANAAFSVANSATNTAAAAYVRANNSLNANTGGAITGSLAITGDVNITGNLFVVGNTTTVSSNNIVIDDTLLYIANNNPANVNEIGFVGHFTSGTYQHTGLVRDHTDSKWKLFSNVAEPGATTVSFTNATYDTLKVGTIEAATTNIGGIDLVTYTTNSFYQANAAYALANTNTTSITAAFTYANGAFIAANSAGSYANAAFAAANASTATDTTQNNSISAVFSLANGTALIANTDYTNISIGSADYGSGSSVAAFKVAANGRIISANTTTIAIDASAISTGTLSVGRGGTGATSFTTNGVLLGAGGSPLSTASSSTEGHVLTINNSGVPTFSHLQGGTF